jgi:hypothetical protein
MVASFRSDAGRRVANLARFANDGTTKSPGVVNNAGAVRECFR